MQSARLLSSLFLLGLLAVTLVGYEKLRTAVRPNFAVPAAAETAPVATRYVDAADDPAIWAAPVGHPARLGERLVEGFIAGTDKRAGLYVYSLSGEQLQFLPAGLLNNIDLRETRTAGRRLVVIGASDRSRKGISFYAFDASSTNRDNLVRPVGFISSDIRKPAGLCLGNWNGQLHSVLTGTDGLVRIYAVSLGQAVTGTETGRFAVGSKTEGCAVDDVGGYLYLAEEKKGLWRYPLNNLGRRELVESVGRGRLVSDIEGVSLLHDGERRYLLVSSQGDSSFAVWRVDPPAPVYAGRFSVQGSGRVDKVTGTDGIDARGGFVTGSYPAGLVVVQDDANDRRTQNFKLVDWREIRSHLRH